MSSTPELSIDVGALREQVRATYRDVAADPDGAYHFHTGRALALRLGYDPEVLATLPDRAVESFAGVANPFSLRRLAAGERVVDVGSGAGMDCVVAASQVGLGGRVLAVDMTPEMLAKGRATAAELDLDQVTFHHGLAEALPVDDVWADVVISNGVFNLCADKRAALREAFRVLRSGGRLQFADIATGRPVPEAATRDIDLWTG